MTGTPKSLLLMQRFIAIYLRRTPLPFVTSIGTGSWGESETAECHPVSATRQIWVWLLSWLLGILSTVQASVFQPMNQPMNAKRERYSSLWPRELSNKQGTFHPAWRVRPWSWTPRLLLCGFSPCGGTLSFQERLFETHMQKSVDGCVPTFWVKCIETVGEQS